MVMSNEAYTHLCTVAAMQKHPPVIGTVADRTRGAKLATASNIGVLANQMLAHRAVDAGSYTQTIMQCVLAFYRITGEFPPYDDVTADHFDIGTPKDSGGQFFFDCYAALFGDDLQPGGLVVVAARLHMLMHAIDLPIDHFVTTLCDSMAQDIDTSGSA